MTERITVPAWAKSIRVEKRRAKLIVIGEGRIEDPTVFVDLKSPSLDLLGKDVPLVKDDPGGTGYPPHIQFARANDEAHQIAFVKAFGPIWGTVKKTKPHLVVFQDLAELQREQRIFALAAKILAEIQSLPRINSKNVGTFAERFRDITFELWNEIDLPIPSDPQISMLDAIMKRAGIPYGYWEAFDRDMGEVPDPKGILPWVEYYSGLHNAHWNLNELLNKHPVRVTFFAGQPAELPAHQPEGILPVLYFMLRRDYLGTGRRISTCAFEDCRSLFPVTRAGQKYCSSEHSYLQRGREYWRSRGKKRRKHLKKVAHRSADLSRDR